MGWSERIAGYLRVSVVLCAIAALLGSFLANDDPALARQESAEARSAIRIVHGIANAGPLDVYIDGRIALIGIAFGDSSGDLALDAGEHAFAIVPFGGALDASIAEGQISLEDETRSYAALLGTVDEASVGLYGIDERPVDAGRARFRVISGVPDATEITPAFAGGDALSEPLGFGDASQYAAIDAGVYDLEMLDAATGASMLSLPQTPIAEGTATDIILIGQVSDGTLQALVTPTSLTAVPIEGQVARLHSGECDALGAMVADLGVVQAGQGAAVGVADTPAVAQGFGLAPLSFTALTATPHALAVFDTANADGSALACGEIGGQLTDTGALVVAMLDGAASGPNGVAVLAPALENPEATGVSIFLIGGSLATETNEPGTVSEQDAG